MEEALIALLASVSGGRVYWMLAPQGLSADDGSYIVMRRVDGVRDYAMSGPTGYVQTRVQLDCYGKTYAAAKTAARAVEAVISGYSSATDGGSPPSTSGVLGIFVISERDATFPDAGDKNHLFLVSLDAMVHHT